MTVSKIDIKGYQECPVCGCLSYDPKIRRCVDIDKKIIDAFIRAYQNNHGNIREILKR